MAADLSIVVVLKDKASKALDGIRGKAGKLGATLAKVGRIAALGLAAGLAIGTKLAIDAIGAASDLEEAVNKAAVTFGEAVHPIEKFAVTSAKSFGISKAKALEYSATLGIILQTSGLTQKETAGMSTELVQLAADMASFNNIPIDLALEKIRSGLVGEAEPLRTVGVLLSEAAVKTKAAELGIAAMGEKLTDAQKVQARYGIILEQTAKQQGDFARTSNSLANRQRILGARFEDLRAEIGKKLLPVATKLMGFLIDKALPFFEKNWPVAVEKVREVFEDLRPTLRRTQGFIEDVGRVVQRKLLPPLQRFFRSPAGKRTTWIALSIGVGILAVALLAAAAPVILLTLKIALLMAAIIAISAVIALAIEHWDEMKATVTDAIDSIIAKIEGIPVIGEIFKAAVRVVLDKIRAVVSSIKNLIAFGKELIHFFKAVFRGDWAEAWASLKRLAVIALNLFLNFLQLTFFGTLKSIFAAIKPWNWAKAGFDALLDGIKGLGKIIGRAAFDLGRRVIKGIGDGINTGLFMIKNAINSLIALLERGMNFIIQKWNDLEFKVSAPLGIGSVTIGTPNLPLIRIPRLQKGGEVLRTGLAVVHEGERFSRGGGDINVTFIHNGTLMGNEAEAERFASMLDTRLRRRWRRQHA